jgi:hypothetical protein
MKLVGIIALGKFKRVLAPGMTCIRFPLERVVARLSLKVRHLEIHCDSKTKDNVFVKVVVAGIVYSVIKSEIS